MSKCKKTPKRFDSINVIPFIDIMLVLLVMVLTTATFIRQGIINVDLPTTKGATKKQNNKNYRSYFDSCTIKISYRLIIIRKPTCSNCCHRVC